MSRLRRPHGVGVLDYDGILYAARLPEGPIAVLDGVAALIWEEACAGDRSTIPERVAQATDVEPDLIRAHVVAFVADLMARGLLE